MYTTHWNSGWTREQRRRRDPLAVIIKDAFGREYAIYEARPTKYGFDLYYGKETGYDGYVLGAVRLIYTEELRQFWERHSLRHDGTIFDLPAGRTTLKRARMALGFHWNEDSDKFWKQRKEDLTLKPREFEAKYKEMYGSQQISGQRMSDWRMRLLGGKARPQGWWRTPETLALLLSEEKSLNQVRGAVAEKISTSQAHRLRRQAKRDYEWRDGSVVARAA